MSNIKPINSNKNCYSYIWRKTKYSLSFDDEYLYKKWNGRMSSGTKVFTLANLIPKFDTQKFSDKKVDNRFRISVALFLFSLVFYFSDYFKTIPLLLPFILLYSFIFFPKPVSRIFPDTWLFIFDNYGNHALSIYISDDESDEESLQRHCFEEKLSKQIEKAINASYE